MEMEGYADGCLPRNDPAYDLPLPDVKYLDAAARKSGFRDWFHVPAFFRDPVNRLVIVNARLLALRDRDAARQGGDAHAAPAPNSARKPGPPKASPKY